MFLQLLLLLALLGPGSSHQLGNTSKYEPVKVPGEERVPEDDEDYDYIGQTDPPEMLDNITEVPKFLLMVATLGQRESAGPVTYKILKQILLLIYLTNFSQSEILRIHFR